MLSKPSVASYMPRPEATSMRVSGSLRSLLLHYTARGGHGPPGITWWQLAKKPTSRVARTNRRASVRRGVGWGWAPGPHAHVHAARRPVTAFRCPPPLTPVSPSPPRGPHDPPRVDATPTRRARARRSLTSWPHPTLARRGGEGGKKIKIIARAKIKILDGAVAQYSTSERKKKREAWVDRKSNRLLTCPARGAHRAWVPTCSVVDVDRAEGGGAHPGGGRETRFVGGAPHAHPSG